MKRTYIIDGNSLLYRAFFAVPPFKTSKGIPTNAIYGFTKMLIKLLKEKSPDHIIVVFDAKGGSQSRRQILETYKAQRAPMPEDMLSQKPYLQMMVQAFNIPIIEQPGYEADDVLGTVAFENQKKKDMETYIVTGDKDLMQFVQDPNTSVYDTMKEVIYHEKEVKEKMGVPPVCIRDLLALMGDTSDNIPGVYGIGPKTAVQLLEKYKNLDGVYEHLEEISGSTQQKLKEQKEKAYVSFELAKIHTNVPLDVTILETPYSSPDITKALELCETLEFSSLKKEILSFSGLAPEIYIPKKPVHEKRYITVTDQKMFDDLIEQIKTKKKFALDTETNSLDTLEANIVGLSLSLDPNIGFYIPLRHEEYEHNIDARHVLYALKEILDDTTILKIGHNIKYDLAVIEKELEDLKSGKTINLNLPDTQNQLNLL